MTSQHRAGMGKIRIGEVVRSVEKREPKIQLWKTKKTDCRDKFRNKNNQNW